MSRPACTRNACREGRKACPCPQACQLPDAPPADNVPRWIPVALLLLFLAVALAGLIEHFN